MKSFKQHPFALIFFLIYLYGWFKMGFLAYVDFYHYADGQAIGAKLFTFFIYGFLPYFLVTFIIYEFSRESRPFYLMLVRLILAAIPVFVLIGTIVDAIAPA